MKSKKTQPLKKKKWISVKATELYDPSAAETAAKIRITTYIDSDVLGYYKGKATELGIPYQTLLNAELKQSMGSKSKELNKEDIRQIIREELDKAS